MKAYFPIVAGLILAACVAKRPDGGSGLLPLGSPAPDFSARDAAGQEVYTWTAPPGRSILGPGEKMEFRSRFVSPPENAVDVMVRFSSDPAPGAK